MKSKRKVSTILVITLLMTMGVTAYAASYSFHFEPPFVGCIQHSSSQKADGNYSAYVDPSGTTNATTYVLTMPSSSSTDTVSNYKTNVTSSKTYFTYDTGYGGEGQWYKLTGYPSNSNFQEYYSAGTWKP